MTVLKVSYDIVAPLSGHCQHLERTGQWLAWEDTSRSPAKDSRLEMSKARTTTSGFRLVQCWFGLDVS